jgi:hypothetical protein
MTWVSWHPADQKEYTVSDAEDLAAVEAVDLA